MQHRNDVLARLRRVGATALLAGVLVTAAPAAAQADPSAGKDSGSTADTQGTPPGPPTNFNPK